MATFHRKKCAFFLIVCLPRACFIFDFIHMVELKGILRIIAIKSNWNGEILSREKCTFASLFFAFSRIKISKRSDQKKKLPNEWPAKPTEKKWKSTFTRYNWMCFVCCFSVRYSRFGKCIYRSSAACNFTINIAVKKRVFYIAAYETHKSSVIRFFSRLHVRQSSAEKKKVKGDSMQSTMKLHNFLFNLQFNLFKSSFPLP